MPRVPYVGEGSFSLKNPLKYGVAASAHTASPAAASHASPISIRTRPRPPAVMVLARLASAAAAPTSSATAARAHHQAPGLACDAGPLSMNAPSLSRKNP